MTTPRPSGGGRMAPGKPDGKRLLAGAQAVDITPQSFPVIVNGSFFEKIADSASDPLHARALVLDDGGTRLAIVLVDSGLLPRELLDRAKDLASQATGIPSERMLIAATHSHATPSVMGALGSDADHGYTAWLPGRIAESIVLAAGKLAPARIGWTAAEDWEHTNCRRWITRPDRMLEDPFGERSVRAMMHPGHENPDYIGPSGPVDPGLTILSVQTSDGSPLALLANYSMHYFGSTPVSADYFGQFATLIGERIGAPDGSFVAMMSQGTSGDLQWIDYARPRRWTRTLEAFTGEVLQVAEAAYRRIEHQDWVPLAMAETLLLLRRRTPDRARLAWARKILAGLGGARPADKTAVFAREQVLLHQEPRREMKFQALRIGGLGITAMPTEAFALTGLKLKARSPLAATFNITLANGAEGYIPPVEQHRLGGYVTWPARTAGLEIGAERRITRTLLGLLEQVSGRPRRSIRPSHGPYARAVLALRPWGYWRLDEMEPPAARDASGNKRHARYDGDVAFYLPGAQVPGCGCNDRPQLPSRFSGPRINRAPHLAGGLVRVPAGGLGPVFSLSLWFWSGLPAELAPGAMRLASAAAGGSLALLGGAQPAHLAWLDGALPGGRSAGGTDIASKTWHNVVVVYGPEGVRVYLDGQTRPEISVGPSRAGATGPGAEFRLGGPTDAAATGLEGKLDEAALFDRELLPEEIAALYKTARADAATTGACSS